MKSAVPKAPLAALLCPSCASAQIYKCVDAKNPETRTTILYVGEAVERVKRDIVRAT